MFTFACIAFNIVRVLEAAAQHNLEHDKEMVAVSERLMANAVRATKTGGVVAAALDDMLAPQTIAVGSPLKMVVTGLRVIQLVFAVISFAIL